MAIARQNTLVTVVICVYNGESFLKECLKSVIQQTYQELEILVIDDGSTDDSHRIIDWFAARDERFRTFRRQNSGLAESRNFAFSKARGEWIAIIDQDDLCYPNRIEKQLSLAASYPSARLIFCDTDYIDVDGQIIGSHLAAFKIPKNFIPKKVGGDLLLTKGCFIDSEAWFFRKCVIRSIGCLDSALKYACDYEYFIRIGLEFDMAYTTEKLSAWRIHPTQESATNNKQFYEHRRVLWKYFFSRGVKGFTKVRVIKNIIRSTVGEIYRNVRKNLTDI